MKSGQAKDELHWDKAWEKPVAPEHAVLNL